MARVDLTGAVDLHTHFGPDPRRERGLGALETARAAAAAGHLGVVLKSHHHPTAPVASVVGSLVPDLRVLGGVCCNHEMGGVNPVAVEASLAVGARIVWLPTLSSRQDQLNGVGAALGIPGPGLRVIDEAGALTDAAHAVLDLVQVHGAVLGTGHVTVREHLAVAREFARRGPVVVTHARETRAGPNLDLEACIALADLGALIEFSAMTAVGSMATRTLDEIAASITAIGPQRCTLATDFGLAGNPSPAEGLQRFADGLAERGLSHDQLRRMACANPAAALGLT